jgi:hypothetical protein
LNADLSGSNNPVIDSIHGPEQGHDFFIYIQGFTA